METGLYKIRNSITGDYIKDSQGNIWWDSIDKVTAKIEKLTLDGKKYEPANFIVEEYSHEFSRTINIGDFIRRRRLKKELKEFTRLTLAKEISKKKSELYGFGFGNLSIQEIKDLISDESMDKGIAEIISDIIIDLTMLTDQFTKLSKK